MQYDHEERLQMVNEFVTESRELLDDAEPQIIAMERSAAGSGKVDTEILNGVFRLFHSLKGMASFLDLKNIMSVTHEAETLLDLFRKGQMCVESRHVDLFCCASDFIREALDTVEREFNDQGFENEAEKIIGELRKVIGLIQNEEVSCRRPETSGNAEEDTVFFINSVARPPEQDAGISSDEVCLEITPEMAGRFKEEIIELCDEAESAILAMEREPDNMEHARQAFRAVHSIKGNAGFLGYAVMESISFNAENVLDALRESHSVCDPIMTSFLLIAIDALREAARQVGDGKDPVIPESEELIRRLNNLAMTVNVKEKEEVVCGSQGSEEVNEKDERKPNEGRSEGPGRKDGDGNGDRKNTVQQVIRVDVEKLDKLLDLVGEMVIAESMVANSQDGKGLHDERFEKAVLQLDKITREIQEVAMSMRMIPLSGTFRKMMRLVRDLANKEDKLIDLRILGEETEVDKTIIEQISDPLVHIIRNSVDHGIESPEERMAVGKPETGRITIEAKHSAGEVWIIIEDDGRGLNREKIIQKALERGLIKNADRDLKDEEVWRLIFEPGFSTAEKVSDVSGRGVGMDVVKRNIDRLRGKVDIRSRAGAGTAFIIRIPLTLAIIEGMVVRVGQARYTIPINSIKESFQPLSSQITCTPDNLEIVRLRGELLPVIRLHEVYSVLPVHDQLVDGILIMVESDEKKCCLFVDELVGQQQIVIKGLSNYLGHVKGISGCAILGDGDISMILDVADLINTVEGTVN